MENWNPGSTMEKKGQQVGQERFARDYPVKCGLKVGGEVREMDLGRTNGIE